MEGKSCNTCLYSKGKGPFDHPCYECYSYSEYFYDKNYKMKEAIKDFKEGN